MANVAVRPNILFNVAGALVGTIGLVLLVAGVLAVVEEMRGFDPLAGDPLPRDVADGISLALWGIVGFTIGRYLWRGARRRGARDRFGRLLIIAGLVLVGVALHSVAQLGPRLWTRSESVAEAVVTEALITLAVWGLPGTVLASIGYRLAGERELAEFEASVGL